MSDYCNCNDFEKAVDYKDIRYYRPEDDKFNAMKAGWYIYSLSYERPIASLELFRYCPWCIRTNVANVHVDDSHNDARGKALTYEMAQQFYWRKGLSIQSSSLLLLKEGHQMDLRMLLVH